MEMMSSKYTAQNKVLKEIDPHIVYWDTILAAYQYGFYVIPIKTGQQNASFTLDFCPSIP